MKNSLSFWESFPVADAPKWPPIKSFFPPTNPFLLGRLHYYKNNQTLCSCLMPKIVILKECILKASQIATHFHILCCNITNYVFPFSLLKEFLPFNRLFSFRRFILGQKRKQYGCENSQSFSPGAFMHLITHFLINFEFFLNIL